MAYIQLDASHRPIIESTLALGDWLLSHSKVNESARELITKIQHTLQQLPEVKNNTFVMYGISVETIDGEQGLIRGWDVSLEYFADDEERQGGLECFTSYIPVPDTTDPEMLKRKKEQEIYFHWPIGDICNFITPQQADIWLSIMNDPKQGLEAEENLRVELVYEDQYIEIEF